MKNILYKSFVVLAAGFMLGACDKNAIEDNNDPVTGGAFIKFAHTAPAGPAVNWYLDNVKVSGLAATSTGDLQGMGYSSNSIFPASYGYANVPAGTHTLQAIDTVRAGGSADVIVNSSVALNEGKHYTSFLTGQIGMFETLLVEDNLPAENYNQFHVRFVNVLQNAPAGYKVELVRTATTEAPEVRTTLGEGVMYKGSTAYVGSLPEGAYTIQASYQNTEGQMVTVKSGSFTPTAGRVYTEIMRGDLATGSPSLVLIRDR